MKRQVVKMINNGVYTVIHDDQEKYNPYRVCYTACYHRKTLKKYGDLASALQYLTDIIRYGITV